MKTRIYYQLAKSPFYFTNYTATFFFSSELHLKKFIARYVQNRDIISYSLSKRFNLKINADAISDIVLYRKIETRGFFIITDKGCIECPELIISTGDKVILKN